MSTQQCQTITTTIGDRIKLKQKKKNVIGTVRFIGEVKFMGNIESKRNIFYGVELDEPKGTNDGSLNNVRYFKCKSNRGIFVKKTQIIQTNAKRNKNAPRVTVGDKVKCIKAKCNAMIRFIGTPYSLQEDKESGILYGLELQQKRGNNNGTINGRQYFECKNKYGIFVRAEDLELIINKNNVIEISKQQIAKHHIYTVQGFIRSISMHIASDVVNLILFFYAAQIPLYIEYQGQIECILLSIDDEWNSVEEKILDVFQINLKGHMLNLQYLYDNEYRDISTDNCQCELAENRKKLFAVKLATKTEINVKVTVLGDSNIGKTALLVKYIEGKYKEEYMATLGLNVLEKSFELKNCIAKLQMYVLGGQRQFVGLLGTAVEGTKAVIFAFNLIQKKSLISIKRWYKDARKLNKVFKPILVGTKYDLFEQKDDSYKVEVTEMARSYAKKMHSPFIMCSAKTNINIKKVFTVLVGSIFQIKIKSKQNHNEKKQPILEYDIVYTKKPKSGKKKKKKKNKSDSDTSSSDFD